MLELAGVEAASGVGQLEGPQEVVGLLEVGADRVDLVDQILNADNAVLAEVLLNDLVVGDGDALLVNLSVAALIDELPDALQVGVTIGNVRVGDGKHLLSGLGEADEGSVVDLEQTEQLQDLAGLRRDLVDTLDTDNKDQLGLLRNVEATLLAGNASEADLLTLSIAILLDVGLSALENDTTLLLVRLLPLLELLTANSASLLLALALLQEGLGDKDLVLSRNGAMRVSIVRPRQSRKISPSVRIAAYSATFSTEGQ